MIELSNVISRPMLGAQIKDETKLRFPLLATPKLDGIRCLILGFKPFNYVISRSFKPIRNRYIKERLKAFFSLHPGHVFDGELMLKTSINAAVDFYQIESAVMSEDGEPDFRYHIFDMIKHETSPSANYVRRISNLVTFHTSHNDTFYIEIVRPIHIPNIEELLKYEATILNEGYEGVMLRSLDSPYKEGRSTFNEHYLLKLKRFERDEAVIKGFEELRHNFNKLETDAFGLAKRSKCEANMRGAAMLGAIIVSDLKSQEEFKIGSGFTEDQRIEIWKNRELYLGKVVIYKHQKHGKKDLPRIPVFIGIKPTGG